MAQLGRLEFTILNPDGSPASGVSLQIRKQGAQIRGTAAASPYTVDDVGGIATGATVSIYSITTKSETSSGSATINSATSIGISPTLGSVNDDDRITTTSPAPTIYEDANAGTSISNTLTTDTVGYASCYADAGYYDVKVFGGGLQSFLKMDVQCTGAKATAYVFDASGAIGFSDNIVSAATGSTVGTAGAVIREFKNAGTRKASIDKDGDFTGTDGHFANVDTSATASVGTNLTVGGTAAVTGATTLAAATASGLITGSAGLTISAGAVSLPAGSVAVAALAAGVTEATGAAQTTVMALSTTPTTITNCSVSANILATSSNVLLLGQCAFDNTAGANRTVTLGLYEDAVLLASTDAEIGFNPSQNVTTISEMHVRTGVSGAKTYTLKASQNTGTDVNALAGTGRLCVIELNK